MFRLFTVLWIVMTSRIVVTEPILERRNNCGCPPFDLLAFPLAPSSGLVGSTLHCIYPDTSRCLYNAVRHLCHQRGTQDRTNNTVVPQTTGVLGLDEDYGLCPATAPGGRCAPADVGYFCLGPGSAVFNSTILICTYPTAAELADTTFYCDYTVSHTIYHHACASGLKIRIA
jgi:hypothetical protein